MEIFAKLTTCPVCSSVYNTENHAQCPFCAGTAQQPATGGFAPTEAPEMASAPAGTGSFGATVAPNMNQSVSSAPVAQPYNPTQPVHNPHMEQASSEPFSPTVSVLRINGDNKTATEPVVGWLVCVEGAMRGNDYRIRAGYNYIGREIGDIHIRGDQTISRQRHAKIVYDDATHQFFFAPDEGRNVIRLNGKSVISSEELHAYDILTIGQSKLLFVPLCGERFSWEQG